ncbi:hypothetical protein JTB14_002747 [Gonioctena quinquepunctata]|nr:hypothetical protein JTB14_002747 [Gonioctena quinquepunctata]
MGGTKEKSVKVPKKMNVSEMDRIEVSMFTHGQAIRKKRRTDIEFVTESITKKSRCQYWNPRTDIVVRRTDLQQDVNRTTGARFGGRVIQSEGPDKYGTESRNLSERCDPYGKWRHEREITHRKEDTSKAEEEREIFSRRIRRRRNEVQ